MNTVLTPEKMRIIRTVETCTEIFAAMRAQNEFEKRLEEIGFNFDYNHTPAGRFLGDARNVFIDSLSALFGLNMKHHRVFVNIQGECYPCHLDVLYPDDGDLDFAISEDNFCDLIQSVINDEKKCNALTNIWVLKNKEERDLINAMWKSEHKHDEFTVIGVREMLKYREADEGEWMYEC